MQEIFKPVIEIKNLFFSLSTIKYDLLRNKINSYLNNSVNK